MYFSNIGDSELLPFHNTVSTDFSISLTDLLVSNLFKVEQITNSIYRVYPLFYANVINSSNPNDKILNNRCLILHKMEHETYLSFLNNEHENNIIFNENIVNSFNIGDKLTTDEFNGIVYRLRKNKTFNEVLDFNEENIYLGDEILPSLSLNPILNSNKLENMQLKGVMLNKKDNTPIKNKTFHLYYKTDENNWKFIKSINTNNNGEYSYIDYGLNSYFDNSPVGSRDELNTLINNAITNEETVISLDKQYKFQSGDSYITIPESITIEGNGHIIDANGKSRVFNVTGDNVTINNLIIANGNINTNGGGILWTGNNGLLSNSIISDCICNDKGGGVYWAAEKASISNVKFINNATNGKGGGLYFEEGIIHVDGFVSFNNYSNDSGACMYIVGDNCIVKNVTIRDDTSNGQNPSILEVNGDNNIIQNINISTIHFQQNRVDRTTKMYNNKFEYKIIPSTWISDRDDYSVFNGFDVVKMSSLSNEGDTIDVLTFKGKYSDFKVYNLGNQLKNNNGVIINNAIKNNPLKVKLINNSFKHANYNLKAKISSINDVNLIDIINNNIITEEIIIPLKANETVEIDLNDFENDNLLHNIVNVDIDFNVPEIVYTPQIKLSGDSETVFVSDDVVLTAKYTDSENNPVINTNIVFKDGNDIIGQSKTNNEGIATLTYNTSVTGSHIITAESDNIISNNLIVNFVGFDSIVLSSDKTILSYVDDESAALTAQLLYDGSSVARSGETVTFEVRKQSDDSLVETLTGTTDATGKTVVSYNSKGTGELYIKAKSQNIVSEEILIEDCLKYNPNSYSSDTTLNYPLDGGYEINWISIKRNTNSGSANSIDLGNHPYRINVGNNSSTSLNCTILEQSSSVLQEVICGALVLNTETEHSLKYENGIFTYSVNGNTVTMTPTTIFPTSLTMLRCGSNSVIKNIKIKKVT